MNAKITEESILKLARGFMTSRVLLSGAELDLFFLHRVSRYGIEFKFNEAPKITGSMRTASKDLGLQHLWVIYHGHFEPFEYLRVDSVRNP